MSLVSAVDLFCGVGGMTHGLIQAGINVIAGIDNDETCQFAFERNNKTTFINKDIRLLKSNQINKLFGEDDIRVLVGCAPCQPFSKHTQKDKDRESDEKWGLLYDFLRLVSECNPTIVSMENVPGITKYEVFTNFVAGLESLDYELFWDTVYCPDYGIPQSRRRFILLASKLGAIDIIPATHTRQQYKTVRDNIGKLEVLAVGEVSALDPLHRTSKLSDINIKRIRQSRPGGTWMDWDEDLRSPCHKKDSGRSYSGVYARMSWNSPAPTLTTQFYNYGTGRFGHPEQNRALSLREGALLQTFPEDYDFIDPELPFSIKRIGRHIGNAVPVRLGYIIGKTIQEHIKTHFENGKQ